MTVESYVRSAYGVIIRNSEHEALHKISEKFCYGEEEIDHDLPESNILDGEIDFEKLDKKYPGLSADISGEVALEMNRSLVVFVHNSGAWANLEMGQHDAVNLPDISEMKAQKKALKKFCRKYGVEGKPGWVLWSAAS